MLAATLNQDSIVILANQTTIDTSSSRPGPTALQSTSPGSLNPIEVRYVRCSSLYSAVPSGRKTSTRNRWPVDDSDVNESRPS